jgi:hypothetical protein
VSRRDEVVEVEIDDGSSSTAAPTGRASSVLHFHDPSQRAVLAGHADLSTTQRYMHLSPAATEDAIRLLDGRQSGLESVEKFGDILDTREATTGSI